MNEQLIVIREIKDLQPLIDDIKSADFIAFDCETNGLSQDSFIIGFSIATSVEKAYYVVLSEWNKELNTLTHLDIKKDAIKIVESLKDRNLICHNGVFDCTMVNRNYNIDLMPSLHTDTMILAHLLDENRRVGLKELGFAIFGEDAKEEARLMKESVLANGGKVTKKQFDMFKADSELLARYGAKDALLTLKLFYHMVPQLLDEGLDAFFYDEECMPLLRGPTYEMNTTGFRVDIQKIQSLKKDLEIQTATLNEAIAKDIAPLIKDKYPGTNKKNTFNIGSGQQLGWLIFEKCNEYFLNLTDGGKEVCKALNLPMPYTMVAKRNFIHTIQSKVGQSLTPDGKKKIKDYWCYAKTDANLLKELSSKYTWIKNLLQVKKNEKMLSTYVDGIIEKIEYGVVRPSFLQHGTTSGRYSSKKPNFQNLPRDDKRVKNCFIARQGKVFVGSDFSQVEPRVFASLSGDERLQKSFFDKDDFYSVVGVEVFNKFGCSLKKDAPDSFAKKHPELRQKSKTIALAAAYGTTAHRMSGELKCSGEEAQMIIDDYFEKFPKVLQFMKNCHKEVTTTGKSMSLYGRPRRIPECLNFHRIYKNTPHDQLPYEARNLLNLSVNHKCQSTAASICNRSMIRFYNEIRIRGIKDCKLVCMVHDEIVVECKEQDAEIIKDLLRECMEKTVVLPNVLLEAEPNIGKSLGELK